MFTQRSLSNITDAYNTSIASTSINIIDDMRDMIVI